MYRILMVEDDEREAETLRHSLERYARENSVEFQVSWEKSALGATSGDTKFDLIFMDIGLPGINGMEAATLIRTYDSETPIIFVTNLAQYAVRGYEVDAVDFMVKPVSYESFRMRMSRAMRAVERNTARSLRVKTRDGLQIFAAADLLYVETQGHDVAYHVAGEPAPFVVRDSLRHVEGELAGLPFVRFSSSALANMAHVRRVRGDEVRLSDGTTLFMSRARKREAQAAIASYLGGGF